MSVKYTVLVCAETIMICILHVESWMHISCTIKKNETRASHEQDDDVNTHSML